MPAQVGFVIVGQKELRGRLDRAAKQTRSSARAGMQEAVLLVASTAKQGYLSGPRPGRLGVVTGRLRSSIATEVKGSGAVLQGIVGSNVKYARIHELGGTILPKTARYLKFFYEAAGHWVTLRRVEMPARPFLSTALRDKAKEVGRLIGGKVFGLLQKGK